MAGPALLAHVLVSKYCDHIPLHRLARIQARDGVVFDPSTCGGWVEQSHALLDPLVDARGRYALASAKVRADDTPVAVLDPRRGRTKTGRLWVYVRDDRPAGSAEPSAAWYRYSPNHKGEHPQDHLKAYHGILQADAYGGYGRIYATGSVAETACWVHTRRPFWDVYEGQGRVAGSIAEQALQRISALHAVEAPRFNEQVQHRLCEASTCRYEVFSEQVQELVVAPCGHVGRLRSSLSICPHIACCTYYVNPRRIS